MPPTTASVMRKPARVKLVNAWPHSLDIRHVHCPELKHLSFVLNFTGRILIWKITKGSYIACNRLLQRHAAHSMLGLPLQPALMSDGATAYSHPAAQQVHRIAPSTQTGWVFRKCVTGQEVFCGDICTAATTEAVNPVAII